MDLNDIVGKAKVFFFALRHKQTEKVLAILAAASLTAGPFLRQEFASYPQAAYLAYGIGGAFALWLVFRAWRLATPPPEPPAGPVPSAIKGLFPFTIDDGRLFAQLGRHMELQQLLGLARNDRCAISAVRGESGAGKTSLLQAGLAFTLGAEQCIYWEAVPDKASEVLLYAIRSQFPGIESLESLPETCPRRCVLILDQLEQLRPNEPAHAQIFALLDRIAEAPAPHKLSVIIGFRRDYMPDWADLEYTRGFRAEQMPLNLLAPTTAGDALVTLAGAAGFTLDQALVDNFISGVTGAQGVSPVDIAIGVLSLANFVQQSGTAHVGLKEYSLAGGVEGLLLSFVEQKLEEVPEGLRAPLLKGIVLALVSPSSKQRIAAGKTSAAISVKAEMAESALAPLLARLAHPRVRLLEKVAGDRYRLTHERLVPVLRRLAGQALASIDHLRLVFEDQYAHWQETRSRQHLLRGKDLRDVLRWKGQWVLGARTAAIDEYLTACVRRRLIARLALSALIVVAGGAGAAITGYRAFQIVVALKAQLAKITYNVRYLPEWPSHVDELSAFLRGFSPGDQLVIDADVGYAHFSQPTSFMQYFDSVLGALERVGPNGGIVLRMLVSDEDTNLNGIRAQFDPGRPDDFMLIRERHPERLKAYCWAYSPLIGKTPLCLKSIPEYQDFQDAVLYVENALCMQLVNTGRVRVVKTNDSKLRSRFLWIKYRNNAMLEMIFAYPNFYGPERGYAWKTQDGHLIEVFLKEFNASFAAASTVAVNEIRPGDQLYPRAFERIRRDMQPQTSIGPP